MQKGNKTINLKMKNNHTIEGIPEEVWKVQVIVTTRQYVGGKTMDEIKRVIKKYPEYFPWETTYNSIPQEVHDAYQKEAFPERFKPIEFGENDGKGIQKAIEESLQKPVKMAMTFQDLAEFVESMNKHKRERAEREKEIERIWNKHYKKYKLRYGGTVLQTYGLI